MTEFFIKMLGELFNNNIVLATVLVSMLPIFELRGAIPFATNTMWGNLALSNWQAFGWAFLGSSLVVPLLAWIYSPIIKWLKNTKLFGKIAAAIENRIKNKASSISGTGGANKKFGGTYWKRMLSVMLFVAVPLPLTGVWTGTCVAIFLGLDYLSTCASVITGNAIAGVCIALILQFFPALNKYLLYIFLGIVAVVIIYELIRYFIKRKKTGNNPPATSN